MSEQWPIFTYSYNMDGSEWSFELPAKDWDDARRRLASIGMTGRVDGQLAQTVDAEMPLWAKICLWLGLIKVHKTWRS
jgi:hypothetical protein